MTIEVRGRVISFPVSVPRIGGIHPDKAIKNRYDIARSLAERTGHIQTLKDLAQKLPFTSNVHSTDNPARTLVLDIDGVITPNSFESLRALRTVIAPHITEFIPWSGRFHLGGERKGGKMLPFPFADKGMVGKLQDSVKKVNPACDTSTSMVGFRKQLPSGKQEFTRAILDRLQKGHEVIIVGSDNVDDERVRQVIQAASQEGVTVQNLHYYCTDRALIPSVAGAIRKSRR